MGGPCGKASGAEPTYLASRADPNMGWLRGSAWNAKALSFLHPEWWSWLHLSTTSGHQPIRRSLCMPRPLKTAQRV